MSITDPLIKELKGLNKAEEKNCNNIYDNRKAHTFKLTTEVSKNSEVKDDCPDLLPLCTILEEIFQKGLIGHCWDWLEEMNHEMETGLIRKSFSYMRAVETAKTCQKINTPTGRLRLLIRSCLANKCLHVPVEIVVRFYRHCGRQWYDPNNSILGDEILGEIFLSVVLQCSTLCFKLDVTNARFLDSTFVLPYCVQVEFVPCSSLGVAVTFIDDKALVVQVDEKSVAAEDNQIQIGDVLDELNGQVLRTDMKGKLNSIMNKSKSKPISVRLIKSMDCKGELIYPPIAILLRKANIKISDVKKPIFGEKNEKEINSFFVRGGFKVEFIGSMVIGSEGDVKQIEYAVSCILSSKTISEPTPVYLECQDLGLKIISKFTGKVLFYNTFMEISSCGQTKKHPKYFAYIAGDNICNLATKFTCYVFSTDNENDVQTILQSIKQGFQRTHFAV